MNASLAIMRRQAEDSYVAEIADLARRHLAGEHTSLVKPNRYTELDDVFDSTLRDYGPPPAREWAESSACHSDSNPKSMLSDSPTERTAAKKVCEGCPVFGQCLSYALQNPGSTSAGIWAGMSRKNLIELRLALRKKAYAQSGATVGRFGVPVPIS